ncbi:MAG TPA: PIG-L family deacetylase [Acidimicrobiia bacterium]|nr:PIG-L family deacetylase [Acidimicrobiia bacterium]
MTVDLDVPRCALAVGAHADDVEFGCGATLAKWADAGSEVHLLVLTDGSKGTWERDAVDLVTTREKEQRAAAHALGAVDVTFLGVVDGELDEREAYRAAVCEVIRGTRPDVVLGHDPWKRYRLHPDHRHAGFLTLDALVAARDPQFFPGQPFPPHRPSHLLLFEADEADHAETVDGTLGRKIDALLAHRSQWRSTMGIDDAVDEQTTAFADRIRDEAEADGRRAGLATAAEIFKRIDDL